MNRKDLCGGMQERVNRQAVINYAKELKNYKEKEKKKMKSKGNFGISSEIEFEEKFEEPILKRIRSRRGFF